MRGVVRGEVERLEHEHRCGSRRGCGRSGCSAAIRGGTGGVRGKGEGENVWYVQHGTVLEGAGAAVRAAMAEHAPPEARNKEDQDAEENAILFAAAGSRPLRRSNDERQTKRATRFGCDTGGWQTSHTHVFCNSVGINHNSC